MLCTSYYATSTRKQIKHSGRARPCSFQPHILIMITSPHTVQKLGPKTSCCHVVRQPRGHNVAVIISGMSRVKTRPRELPRPRVFNLIHSTSHTPIVTPDCRFCVAKSVAQPLLKLTYLPANPDRKLYCAVKLLLLL